MSCILAAVNKRQKPMVMREYMATAGECGLRGGYMELLNIHPGTIEEMYKIASINLSPNTMGQVLLQPVILSSGSLARLSASTLAFCLLAGSGHTSTQHAFKLEQPFFLIEQLLYSCVHT